MLNSPNEWHNEEEYTDKFVDDEPDDEYYDGSYDDSEGEDDSSPEDDSYMEDDDEDYEPDKSLRSSDEEDYDDEEDDDDNDEYDSDEEDDGEQNSNRKNIIIAAAVLLIVLLLSGGVFAILKSGKKTAAKSVAAIEKTDSDVNLAIDDSDNAVTNDSVEDEEVSIDVEADDAVTSDSKVGENTSEIAVESEDAHSEDKVKTDDESGLKIEVEDEPQGTFAAKQGDGTVTINIGDVGRKNPFLPQDEIGTSSKDNIASQTEPGLDFEVIEPPQLAAENAEIAKLLNTKVAGILYDQIRPSAIININGVDQLIRVGDTISGFEIMLITKNKVIIQSGNNVYRASVGQPLNAEKIENTVEISNLRTKFWGAEQHHNY